MTVNVFALLVLQSGAERLSPLARWLDHNTREALRYIDATTVFVVTLALLVLFMLVGRWQKGAWASVFDVVRGFLGMLLLFSGSLMAMVLLFTQPPAIELVSRDSLNIAAVLSLILTIAVGLRELYSAFFK